MSTALEPSRVLLRAQYAVFAIFFCNGFNFANYAARLPLVRDILELSESQMGLLLLVGAAGSLIALPLSGLIVQRIGARAAVLGFAVVNTAGLLVAALGLEIPAVVVVGAGIFCFAVGTSVWDAAMNLEGAEVERRRGVTVLPRLHAGFSLGTVVGAGTAAVAAGMHLSLLVHLLVVLSVSLVGVVWSLRYFLATGSPPEAPASGRDRVGAAAKAWTELRTVLLGVVVMAAALTEGAANDWLALAVVDGFGVEHATGAIVFGVFVTAMTVARFYGGALLDRFGRVTVLRGSALTALLGLIAFSVPDALPIAIVGAVLWGAGAGLGFPIGISAAADDPARAASRVPVVATIGYAAFLVGPPVLGFLAEAVGGYRTALLFIAVPVLAGLLVAGVARPQRDVARSAPAADDEPSDPTADDEPAADTLAP